MSSGGVLRAEGVSLWRGGRCLFDSLEFELRPAKLAMLVGANGAGKTTLLRTLAGLAEPTSGHVTWNTRSVGSLRADERSAIAYRGHLDGLKRELTVLENLQVYEALWAGVPTGDVLSELGITNVAETRARHLSAGQRRKAALATLRVTGAQLWLLDEPTTNLDADGRAVVLRWLDTHLAAGGSAVVATHQPEEFKRRGALVVEL